MSTLTPASNQPPHPSLSQLVAQFLQERERDLAQASRRTYRIALEQFAKTCPVPPAQIQPVHVQTFLNGLKGRPFQSRSGQWIHPPASPATYNLKQLALQQFFEWAIESRVGLGSTPPHGFYGDGRGSLLRHQLLSNGEGQWQLTERFFKS